MPSILENYDRVEGAYERKSAKRNSEAVKRLGRDLSVI